MVAKQLNTRTLFVKILNETAVIFTFEFVKKMVKKAKRTSFSIKISAIFNPNPLSVVLIF